MGVLCPAANIRQGGAQVKDFFGAPEPLLEANEAQIEERCARGEEAGGDEPS